MRDIPRALDQPLHHLHATEGIRPVGHQMQAMTALGQYLQRGLEASEEPEVARGEQDVHGAENGYMRSTDAASTWVK